MTQFATFNYPKAKSEIMAFVRAHHYTRRSPGVWSSAHVALNERGKIQAVCLNGQAPYPSVARRFVKCQEHAGYVSWQARMIAQGISAGQLDALLQYSNQDLYQRGYFWNYTMTETSAWLIDGLQFRLLSPGYTGQTYTRAGFHFLGFTEASRSISTWIIDGVPVHSRQGSITITRQNVHTLYPYAKSVRHIRTGAKARFACVLAATERERAERTLLMNFHPQPWEPLRQPRLLFSGLSLPAVPVSGRGLSVLC